MKIKLLASLAIIGLAGCSATEKDSLQLPDGVTHVESVQQTADEIVIPYEKFVLDNGLTVVIHQDSSDPLVDVDVTYHVGSNREQLGYSGFAHFFEHMMFQGSAHVADEEHFKIITEAGGTLNGSTNTDRTNYYNTAPSNQLGTLLWLEADRMGFLLEAITEETFENQRETVKNERGQRVDNAPYGRFWETMAMHMYPEGHPYSWPVIGHMDDLNRAQLDAVRQFFLRWYGPNNATLTIGGDVDVEETLELVNKYFGTIQRGPEVEPLEPAPAVIESDRYVTLEDRINNPLLAISYPTTYLFNEDEPALDAAAKIFGDGPSSVLYQSLVRSGRALSASSSHRCSELACTFTVFVIKNPSTDETLADLEVSVRELVTEFSTSTISEEDVIRFQADIERSTIFGLQSVSGKVRQLAYYDTFLGTPDGITNELQRYSTVTPAAVSEAFNRYVANQPAVLVSVVPMGQVELQAGEPNHQVADITPDVIDSDLPLRPVVDSFDRSIRPSVPDAEIVTLPTVWEGTLENGVKVLGVQSTETPTTNIELVFNTGMRDLDATQAGLSNFVGDLLNERTTELTLSEIAQIEELLGASTSFTMGTYSSYARLSTLTRSLNESVDLLVKRVVSPAFAEDDVERIRNEILQQIRQSLTQGGSLARNALDQVMGDENNPLSYPTLGTEENIAGFTRDELFEFYSNNIPSQLKAVVVSSNLSQEAVMAALAPVGELTSNVRERELGNITWQAPEQTTIYFVNKPEAAQSTLLMATNGPLWDVDGTYWNAQLMNFNLGGSFNSRINQNLREDKGFTYGARSYFNGDQETGSFVVSTEVRADSTLASLQEIFKELEQFKAQGMTQEELDFMKSAYGQRDARAYETPGQKLSLIRQMANYDLSASYLDQRNAAIQNASLDDLNALAAQLLTDDRMAVVVVGDKTTVMPTLEALDLPIVEITPIQ